MSISYAFHIRRKNASSKNALLKDRTELPFAILCYYPLLKSNTAKTEAYLAQSVEIPPNSNVLKISVHTSVLFSMHLQMKKKKSSYFYRL